MKIKHAQNLMDFIIESPSQYQCVNNVKMTLTQSGFHEIKENEVWELEQGGKYFVTKNDSAIVAFSIGENIEEKGFRAAAAHTDSPTITIKPNSSVNFENTYLQVNTAVYGGAVLSSWFDRPLSLGGRLILKTDDPYTPKSVMAYVQKPMLTIPGLAIHLDKEINNGHKIEKQKELLPLFSLINPNTMRDDFIIEEFCKNVNIDFNDVIDYELNLYSTQKGCVFGGENEFISDSRLDDLMMVFNISEALAQSEAVEGIRAAAFFDNEEVGSTTAQGANGNFLENTFRRICTSLGVDYDVAIANSLFVSADMAHGLHPNYPSKYDPTNRPYLGGGICLKYSADFKYSTNSYSAAIFKALCDKAQIKYQKYINNSDIGGGSTIGTMLSSRFNVPVIDMGCPILSMHSIRETGSVDDNYDAFLFFREFYVSNH